MRNCSSDYRLLERFNKKENILMSKRLKNIKATINTKSPQGYYNTLNVMQAHRSKRNLCKLYSFYYL